MSGGHRRRRTFGPTLDRYLLRRRCYLAERYTDHLVDVGGNANGGKADAASISGVYKNPPATLRAHLLIRQVGAWAGSQGARPSRSGSICHGHHWTEP